MYNNSFTTIIRCRVGLGGRVGSCGDNRVVINPNYKIEVLRRQEVISTPLHLSLHGSHSHSLTGTLSLSVQNPDHRGLRFKTSLFSALRTSLFSVQNRDHRRWPPRLFLYLLGAKTRPPTLTTEAVSSRCREHCRFIFFLKQINEKKKKLELQAPLMAKTRPYEAFTSFSWHFIRPVIFP